MGRETRPASRAQPLHRVGLAATLYRARRLVLRDQARRKIELREHARAVGELLRVSYDRDIVLHVLVRPAARMGDKRKLRKDEAELGEEAEQLAGSLAGGVGAGHA